jgi:hypothetical protein
MPDREPIIIKESARGTLFSLQYTAKQARVCRNTLWIYTKKGIIPRPHYKDWRGWTLLTFQQMQAIVLGFRMIRQKRIKREDLAAFLLERWDLKEGDAEPELPKRRRKRKKKRGPKPKPKPKPKAKKKPKAKRKWKPPKKLFKHRFKWRKWPIRRRTREAEEPNDVLLPSS